MLDEIKILVQRLGKPSWRPMLHHLADLHEGSLHAPCFGLPYPWEETAPGGELGIQFGHWDSIHISLDSLSLGSKHGIHQILNNLSLQQSNGLIPGHIAIIDSTVRWTTKTTFPPLWPIALDNTVQDSRNFSLLEDCYTSLKKQIHWFEEERKTEEGGFYYIDYLDRFWESGVEDGIRYDFKGDPSDFLTCVDATSHAYSLYKHAVEWGEKAGDYVEEWIEKRDQLKVFIQETLWDEKSGFFFDHWAMADPSMRHITFEGIWPLVAGAASREQARRVINEYLLDTSRFFTPHPIPSIAISEEAFSNISWRGPVYNSMTFWAAWGCLQYDRIDAARLLLEQALDSTAHQFDQTGSLWECYHPMGEDPRKILRPPLDAPCCDHIGHNPLIAMARLWERITD